MKVLEVVGIASLSILLICLVSLVIAMTVYAIKSAFNGRL